MQCDTVTATQSAEFQYAGTGCNQRATAMCTSQALEPDCYVTGLFQTDAVPQVEVVEPTVASADTCGEARTTLERESPTMRACIGDGRAVVIALQRDAMDCRGLPTSSAECDCLRTLVRRTSVANCSMLFPVP